MKSQKTHTHTAFVCNSYHSKHCMKILETLMYIYIHLSYYGMFISDEFQGIEDLFYGNACHVKLRIKKWLLLCYCAKDYYVHTSQ